MLCSDVDDGVRGKGVLFERREVEINKTGGCDWSKR
jgi:hypothetical protein